MLIHYIIVRRDLPLGTLAAMVTHAAGESAARYEADHIEGFAGATAVVLEVSGQHRLMETRNYLRENDVQFVEVHEVSPPYMGQFMAIGVIPADRESVSHIFGEFQCLKEQA